MRIGEFLSDIGRPVAYYPQLARAVGSVNAAIMLCHLLSFAVDKDEQGGWIARTSAQLEEDTGLSRRQQDSARAQLRTIGLVEERLFGLPAKLQYRVAHEVFGRILAGLRRG